MLLLVLSLPGLGAAPAPTAPLLAALRYYHQREPPHSQGLLFGLLLLRGQLYGASYLNNDIQNEVHEMLRLSDSIIEKNQQEWINMHIVKRMSRGLAWLKAGGEREVGKVRRQLPYRLEMSLISGAPSPARSTACIIEALHSLPASSTCLLLETDPKAKGYTLSHQAIYFLIFAVVKRNTNIAETVLPKICKRILEEVEYSWKKDLPPELADLFIEEVAVCGMANFKEFLTEATLDFILRLQEEEGCFSLRKLDPTEDACEDHLSAVSMVAIGNFLFTKENNHTIGSPNTINVQNINQSV